MVPLDPPKDTKQHKHFYKNIGAQDYLKLRIALVYCENQKIVKSQLDRKKIKQKCT